MRYSMVLATDDGRRFRFEGHKVLHDRFGLWPSDTTTLYVRSATRWEPRSSAASCASSRPTSPASSTLHVTGVDRRASGSGGRHASAPGSSVAPRLRQPRRRGGVPRGAARRIPSPAPGAGSCDSRHPSRWCDGAGRWHEATGTRRRSRRTGWLRLVRYEGGRRGPVLLAAGFGMSATSFLVDTVDTNLTEHLVPRATTSGCSTTRQHRPAVGPNRPSPSTTSPAPTGPRRSPRSGGSPAPGASRRWVTAWARPRCSWRSPTGSTTCGPPCACSSRSTRSPRTSTRSRPRSRSTRCSPGSVCTR